MNAFPTVPPGLRMARRESRGDGRFSAWPTFRVVAQRPLSAKKDHTFCRKCFPKNPTMLGTVVRKNVSLCFPCAV